METNHTPETNPNYLSSLDEAIAASPVGMALTCLGDGTIVLTHMHEEDVEGEGLIFEGQVWIRSISMLSGIMDGTDYFPLANTSFGDKESQLAFLTALQPDLQKGWMSIPNALL